MSTNIELQPLNEQGWRRGFRNLLRHENSEWWGTRRWWMGSLIWTIIINGLIFLLIWVIPPAQSDVPLSVEEVLEGSGGVFINFLGFFGAVGVIIYTQGVVVSEKESGTVEWILSKPVSRSAFVFSKLAANFTGVLVIIVILQSAIFYLQVFLRGKTLDPLRFISAIGLVILVLVFYLTLVIMLGTFFSSRRPVVGIALGVLFGQLMFSDLITIWIPWIRWVEPNTLIMLADQYLHDLPLPVEWRSAALVTAGLSILFVILALWRFRRDEF